MGVLGTNLSKLAPVQSRVQCQSNGNHSFVTHKSLL